MTKLSPDHKYRSVLAAVSGNKKAPDKGLERDLFFLLKGEKSTPTVEQAHDIFSYPMKKETIESLLLSGATPKEVEEIVEVPKDVAEAYRVLFFDPTVFENVLDKLQYANDYTATKYGKEMKTLAVNLGKEVLKVRLSQGNYSVGADEAKNAIRATAFMMAQLVRANPIDSNIARESQRWAQICLKAADDDSGAHDDDAHSLRIELEKHAVSVNEENSGISPDDILH